VSTTDAYHNPIQPWDERDLVLIGDEGYTPQDWAAIPHGTLCGPTRHGCICADCRRVMAEYRRARRRRTAA
jgi:hypothetical protein